MIVKMTNKDEKFYQYMGKFFGSRLVERQTNDRIYDDNNKEWYIYLEKEKPVAFVSIYKNVIKNVYTLKDEYLEEILLKLSKEVKVNASVVTNIYTKIYQRCGYEIEVNEAYKNFVTIYLKNEDEKNKIVSA